MKKLFLSISITLPLLFSTSCAQDTPVQASKLHGDNESFEFTVTVENTSDKTALPSPLSPLAWSVQEDSGSLYTLGSPASDDLQKLAEDGDQEPLVDNSKSTLKGHLPSALAPGEKATFTFSTTPGKSLSIAGMVVQTNDVFLGTKKTPLALFDGRNEPVSGPLDLLLYDAGTEVNQEPGKGSDQAPRQTAANTGTSETENIQVLAERSDGFTYPKASDMYKVTLTVKDDHDHEGEHEGEEDHDGDHDGDHKDEIKKDEAGNDNA